MQPPDKRVAVWDAHADVVETVAICPDGRTLLSGGINDSHLRIWDLQTLEPSTARGRTVQLDRKDHRRAAGPHRPVRRRRHLARFPEHPRPEQPHLAPAPAGACGHEFGDIALSADESLAASVSLDHTLRLWNLREGAEAAHLTLDAGLVAVAIARNGSWVAAGSESGTLHFARPVWPETERCAE